MKSGFASGGNSVFLPCSAPCIRNTFHFFTSPFFNALAMTTSSSYRPFLYPPRLKNLIPQNSADFRFFPAFCPGGNPTRFSPLPLSLPALRPRYPRLTHFSTRAPDRCLLLIFAHAKTFPSYRSFSTSCGLVPRPSRIGAPLTFLPFSPTERTYPYQCNFFTLSSFLLHTAHEPPPPFATHP